MGLNLMMQLTLIAFGVEHIPEEIIFIEYKHTTWLCVDTSVLDLLILCEKVKVC